MFAEVRQRTGSSWANYTILRTFKDLSFDTKYQDVGAFNLAMRQEDVDSLGIGDQTVIEIAPNGQSHYNLWFSVDGSSGTKTADDQLWRTLNGKSIVSWLADSVVYPSSWPVVPEYDSAGNITPIIAGHQFQNATPGTILRTLIARGVGRGGLSWLDYSTFTGTTTSDSVAWSSTLTTIYTTGTTLLQVLQDLCARRLIQFRMNGMQLQVFNYDSQITHYTPEQVIFQRGKNILEQNSNTDSSQAGGTILIQGDQIAIREITDSTLAAAVGRRRERFVSQGGITDNATLDMLATAELAIAGHIKSEESLGVKDDGIVVPWSSYDVGDWVWEDVNGTLKNIQIKQIAASGQDANNLRIGLTLGDLLDDTDVKLQRRIDNITGSGASSYGALPNQVNNYLAPAAPTGFTAVPTAYRDVNGIDNCQISLSWTAVTTNVDGSVLTDLARYEIQYKIGSSNWSITHNVVPTMSTGFFSNIPSGSVFLAQVRSVDTDGNGSPWVQLADAITLPKVLATPATPSTPTVSAALRGLLMAWDGKDNTGAVYDASFARIDVHVGTVNTFAPTYPTTLVGSITARGGTLSIPGLAYGTTYFVRYVAVDKSGNVSAASAVSAGVTPAQLSDPDLPAKLVTGAKIADGAINTSQLTVAAFGDSVAPNGSFEDIATAAADNVGSAHWKQHFVSGGIAFSRDTTAAQAGTGTACQKISVTGTPWNGWFGMSDTIPTAPGDVWYVKCKAKASRAFTGAISLSMAFGQQGVTMPKFFDAQNPISGITNVDVTTSWVEWEGQIIVPSGTTPNPISQAMLTLQIGHTNDSAPIDFWIDDVVMAPVRGTAYIKDASIVNAKIVTMSADKLTVGTLNADLAVAARIKTGDTGARVELNANGLQAFDATGTQTVNISAGDGSANLAGNLTAGSINAGSISSSTLGSSTIIASLLSTCDYVIDPAGGTLLVYALSGQTTTTITTTGAGSFTVPTGVTTLKVEAWGAGGAGNNNSGAYLAYGGYGGTGGEYAREDNYTVTPGAVLSYYVGNGGAAVLNIANANDGENTTFDGTHIVAHGGSGAYGGYTMAGASGSSDTVHFSGGANGGSNAGGAGGGGSSAGVSALGRPGGAAPSGTVGGAGGAAPVGGGAGGAGGANGVVGTAGSTPGGGGGGGGGGGNIAGSGARGQLRITYGGARTLVASIAGVAGVDRYGNSYVSGMRTNLSPAAGLSGGYYEEIIPTAITFTSGGFITFVGSAVGGKLISDYGSAYNSTTGQWTCPADGVYDIIAYTECSATETVSGRAVLRLSSSTAGAGTLYSQDTRPTVAGLAWTGNLITSRFFTAGTVMFASASNQTVATTTTTTNQRLTFIRRG